MSNLWGLDLLSPLRKLPEQYGADLSAPYNIYYMKKYLF